MLKKTKVNISGHKFLKLFENLIQTKRWKSKFKAYEGLCKNMGLEKTKENINLLMGIRDKAEEKTKLYKYTTPVLKQLRKQGYKIGLISNTSVFSIEQLKKKQIYLNT